jgi:hypothetical protein
VKCIEWLVFTDDCCNWVCSALSPNYSLPSTTLHYIIHSHTAPHSEAVFSSVCLDWVGARIDAGLCRVTDVLSVVLMRDTAAVALSWYVCV